jgi:hypothetical protein
LRWESAPTHHYHVVFWRQPLAPEHVAQEEVMWAADENDVIGAQDVREVIAWADEEARSRKSTYTLWAVVARGSDVGMVWLAGIDPTVWSRPNFNRSHPSDVSPVGGTPSEVYRSSS